MGWSCTSAANETLDLMRNACLKQSGSQNGFRFRGRDFFFEVDRIQHPDGHITGAVIGFDHFYESRFLISKDGVITGGHPWLRAQAQRLRNS